MRKFLVLLVVTALLLPMMVGVEAKSSFFEEKINQAIVETAELRNKYLSEVEELKAEEPLFMEVEGERIPKELTELASFKKGNVEVFVLLSELPIVEELKDKGLDLSSAYAAEYKVLLSKKHSELLAQLGKYEVNFKPIYEFYYTLNGFYLELPLNDLADLRKISSIKEIQFPTLFTTDDKYALDILRAPQVWTSPGVKGEGQVVAIVDTGVDYLHPDLGAGFGAGFKVIGGYDFGDMDSDPMDLHSHGTHVAGIAAAKPATATGVSGVAPEAKIVAYKIVKGGEGSATSAAIAASFEAMVAFIGPAGEKVTSANLSFGSAGGFYSERLVHEIAMDNAVTAGIFVAGSAGNNGWNTVQGTYVSPSGRTTVYPPDIGIAGSPNTAGLVTMVAMSNNTHQDIRDTFNVVEPGTTTSLRRGTIMLGADSKDPVAVFIKAPLEYVAIPSFGNIQANYAGLDVKGKIAVVSRGGLTGEDAAFVNKIRMAQTNGAAMIIVHNDAARGEALLSMAFATDLTIPRIFTGYSHGLWLRENPGKRIIFDGDTSFAITLTLTDPDRVNTGSSWGLTPEMGPKPEVTAPGSPIWNTNPRSMGSYAYKSGTSMAAPYTAGVGLLVKQARPTFTPAMIKTALVNTATVLPHAGTTVSASPRLQGAGRIDIPRAIATPALMNGVGGETFISLGDTDARTSMSFSLRVRNLGATTLTYTPSTVVRRTLSSRAPTTYTGITPSFTQAGVAITSLTVPAGGEATFIVSFAIEAITVDNTFAEGFVTLTPTAGTDIALSIPYVFFVGDFQDVRFRNPATGVTAFAANMVLDSPRDEGGPTQVSPAIGWSWFGRTWLYWSPEAARDGAPLYLLGANHTGAISRGALAISPNADGSQDNLWPGVSFMRGTPDFKIQVRGGTLTAPLNIFTENFVRKNRDDALFRSGWANWWQWNGGGLAEADYFVDFVAQAPSDPSPGDTLTTQMVTLPFKIDVTAPVATLGISVRSGTGLVLNWTASDPVKAGTSGIWGYQITLVPRVGSAVRSAYLAPTATSHTFANIPDAGVEAILSVWDNAGNLTITSFTRFERSVTLAADWNYVGIGSRPINPDPAVVFPGSMVYYFDTARDEMLRATTIEEGRGYWVRPTVATTVRYLESYPFDVPPTLSLGKGWNQLGNLFGTTLTTANLLIGYGGRNYTYDEAVASLLISPTIYSYIPTTGYSIVTSIPSRSGFMINTYTPVTLLLKP